MYIALNNDKKRVHISKVENGEEYYCPICGESLLVRRGTINAHHFAHKTNCNCTEKDGWHYDMSEWHYEWQNQFPIENQEVVFSHNNKIHRADVFINNTVIEFQHSPIKESEFNDRNNFYKDLGYNVIWIFDVENKDIEYSHDSYDNKLVYVWKRPSRFLSKLDCGDSKLNVYLQIGEAIWYRQSDYKSLKDFNELQLDGNIIKICDNNGFDIFVSDDYYSDVEIVDNFCCLEYQNKKRYPYKKGPNFSVLTDEIYNDNIEDGYSFYGYCPLTKTEFYNHSECHACNYLDIKYMRCMYRFKDIKKDKITKIYEVEYDKDGRVKSIDMEFDDKRQKYNLVDLPSNTKTLFDFAQKLKNVKYVRFINIETGSKIQMSSYNLKKLIQTRKCYGKLCGKKYRKASLNEYEIFGWNRPVWLLIWIM